MPSAIFSTSTSLSITEDVTRTAGIWHTQDLVTSRCLGTESFFMDTRHATLQQYNVMDEGRPLTPESLMPGARFIKNQEICPRTGTQTLGHDEGNPAQRTSRCDHGSLPIPIRNCISNSSKDVSTLNPDPQFAYPTMAR